MVKKNILVIYYSDWTYPIRDTIKKHLYCWKSYSRHNIFYVNVAYWFPKKILLKINFDVIIFHTIFLAVRWNREIFKKYLKKLSFLKNVNCLKIAIPQDEFLNTDLLNDFINDYNISYIFTNAFKEDYIKIYDKVDYGKVRFKTVLTGYVDEETVNKVKDLQLIIKTRDIDIGYRAWKAEYWLGERGVNKFIVAEVFKDKAEKYGYKTDISLKKKDTLLGDEWFKFLLRCKATIGVEGGASMLDRNGSIRKKVVNYIKINPKATFEETRQNCFENQDNSLSLACISPRHFEACITKTLQFLIEGDYNDILIPWKHYIPVKKDYSDVDEVIKILENNVLINNITTFTYEDIIESERYTYKNFVKEIENSIIDNFISAKNNLNKTYYIGLFNFIESKNWFIIKLKARILKFVPNTLLEKVKSSLRKI